MSTASEIRAWVESTRPRDWYGMCAGLTDRVVAAFTGGTRQWYDSATDARNASGPLNGDASKCPAGGIHYWSYTGTAWDGSRGDWGHVTIDIYGGGGSTLSATGHAYEPWGVNAGLISVASQSQRAGMRYLGWSRTFGAASPLTITNGSAAGGGATPFPKEDDMDATQAAQLAQAATDISVVKQLLAETQQWKGVIATTSETNTTVGIIKQLLMETEQWTGIDTRVSQILAAVRDIAEAAASDAARDAALASVVQQIATSQGVDPAALTQIITDAAKAGAASALGQLNFPTAETIAQQVATQQDRVRLAALQAEVDRLTAELDGKRLFADKLAKPGS